MGPTAYLQYLDLQVTAIECRIESASGPWDRAFWRRVLKSQSKLAADLKSYLAAMEMINDC
jgi:hypothetical protein